MISKAYVAYDKFENRFWSQSDITATTKVNIYQTYSVIFIEWLWDLTNLLQVYTAFRMLPLTRNWLYRENQEHLYNVMLQLAKSSRTKSMVINWRLRLVF